MLQFWATKWQKVKPDHRKSSSRRYRLRWTLTRRNGPLSRLRFINHASSCSSENGRPKKNADGRPRSAMAAMTFKRFQFRKTMPRNRSARVRFLNGQYLCRRIRSSFFIFFFLFRSVRFSRPVLSSRGDYLGVADIHLLFHRPGRHWQSVSQLFQSCVTGCLGGSVRELPREFLQIVSRSRCETVKRDLDYL